MFTPYTPYGELQKILQDVDSEVSGRRSTGRVRVVEKLGIKLIHSLGNRVPWKSEECGRQDCKPCSSKPGSCRMKNLTYSIKCKLCSKEGKTSVYWGETHRAWWDRYRDHQRALQNHNMDYAIVKHMANQHPEETPDFEFKADRSWKTSLDR